MDIATMLRKSKQVVSDNAPAILTGAGVAGTIATGVLAGRAGFRAGYKVAHVDLAKHGLLSEEDQEVLATGLTNDRTSKETFQMTWKLYMAPTVTGVGTIAAIATANKINMQRMAGLAAAYTITNEAFSEYKGKVRGVLGEKKEKTEVQDSIVQDRVNASADRAMMVIDSAGSLCYDMFSDRYFTSSMEDLKKAQNDANYELMHSMYLSLSEFYSKVGLAATGYSDEVGWSSDQKIELHFSPVMTANERPALGFTFHVEPVRRYDKVHG